MPQMLRELKILTKYRNFLELCFAVLVSMIGFGLILPLLPIYGREMGASGVYLGLLTSLFGITRSITSLPGGVLADKVGRKKLIVGGLLAYTVVMFLFGVSTNLYHLLILRACQGAASGVVWPVAATMVADIVEPKAVVRTVEDHGLRCRRRCRPLRNSRRPGHNSQYSRQHDDANQSPHPHIVCSFKEPFHFGLLSHR